VKTSDVARGAAQIAEALEKKPNGQQPKAVFFGGAGVSTESGIPDFRSEKGLYQAKQVYGYPPEVLLSHEMFVHHPELFYKYYVENLIDLKAKPNPAHIALAELEKQGIVTAVVTQNIDGLHQIAGSENVIELHGSNWRPYCLKCGKQYSLEWLLDKNNWRKASPAPESLFNPIAKPKPLISDDAVVPRCEIDDAVVRPDVVLYGEGLEDNAISQAAKAISEADMLIVAGTSLAVYPAAGLVNYFRGDTLVEINLTPTDLDQHADILIAEPVGAVMKEVVNTIGA